MTTTGAGDVHAEHVTLECECIDRVYANVYVPRLQYAGGIAHFFRGHRGATFASTVLADPISKGFVAAIHRFAESRGVPVIRFAKGQRKDDVALSRDEGSRYDAAHRCHIGTLTVRGTGDQGV